MRRNKNADPDGRTEEINASIEFTGDSEEPDGSETGSGAATAGDTDSGLYATNSSGGGGTDSSDSVSETPKRKRGRPVGSKSANAVAGGGDRRKLADTFTGAVGFGISWYGSRRASKYKQYSIPLAAAVYNCYQIPAEQAAQIGQPLADTFCAWFPNYVKTASKGIDPGLAIARLFTLLQQLSENEKLTVAKFQQQIRQPNNGSSDESSHEAWMNQQSPSPDEINQ